MNAIYVWSSIEKIKSLDFDYVFLSANNFKKDFSNIIKSNKKVFAMASTNEFAIYLDRALKYIDNVVGYNKNSHKFSGVHFDIEPHCLPNYKKNKNQFLESYLDMIKGCYNHIKNTSLEFGVSIPFWYSKIKNNHRSYSDIIADNSDHISIMAYRPKTSQIIKDIKKVNSKNTFVAVKDFDKISELKKYANIAIHHYHTWRKYEK